MNLGKVVNTIPCMPLAAAIDVAVCLTARQMASELRETRFDTSIPEPVFFRFSSPFIFSFVC